VVLISDTRVSGVSSGAIGVHCAPEAAIGGPIGMIHDGDAITIDLEQGTIDAGVDFSTRQPVTVAIRHTRGYLAEFAALVSQADQGCVSRPLTVQPQAAQRQLDPAAISFPAADSGEK